MRSGFVNHLEISPSHEVKEASFATEVQILRNNRRNHQADCVHWLSCLDHPLINDGIYKNSLFPVRVHCANVKFNHMMLNKIAGLSSTYSVISLEYDEEDGFHPDLSKYMRLEGKKPAMLANRTVFH
jgi:hypothetical protein